MTTRANRLSSQANSARRSRKISSWLLSPWFGYLACVFLIGGVWLLEKLNEALPHAPIFLATPFTMVSVFVAMVWGIGPALVSVALGLFVIARFLSPSIVASGILTDISLVGPFIFVQLMGIGVVIQLERSRRKLLATSQALAESHQQLERANNVKDYIIMRSSHELRTPLTTILGRTQLLSVRLKKSEVTPENWAAVQQYLEVVEARALHLRALIDSLFKLSRVHAGEIPLRGKCIELGALCHKIVENQRNLSGRSIEIKLPAQPLLLQANEELVSQVVVNLVANAIKYSSETSAIQMGAQSNDHQVTLQIQNDHPGLSPDQLEHLFEPFYRTTDVEYSSIPGWGLGLTVCKEIVEQYGGQIWAESSEETGVSFFVKLPLAAERLSISERNSEVGKSLQHVTQRKQERGGGISGGKPIPHSRPLQGAHTQLKRVKAIWESFPDSLIACDRNQKIVRINTAACKLFEVASEAQCQGRDYRQFLEHYLHADEPSPFVSREQWLMNLVPAGKAGASSPEQTLLLALPSGRKVFATVRSFPVADQERGIEEIVFVFHELTYYSQAISHLQHVHKATLDLLTAIAQIPEQMDHILPEETFLLSPPVLFVAQQVVNVIRQVLDCHRVMMFAFGRRTGHLHFVAGSGLTAEQEQHWRDIGGRFHPLDAVDDAVCARLGTNQEVVLATDQLRTIDYLGQQRPFPAYPCPVPSGSEAFLFIPLFLEQQWVGALVIGKASSEDAYPPEEIALVKAVTGQTMLLIEGIHCFYAQGILVPENWTGP